MPPVCVGKKSCERWRIKLETRLLVTNVEMKKQAITGALLLPEGNEGKKFLCDIAAS